jgi:hypothetical protein
MDALQTPLNAGIPSNLTSVTTIAGAHETSGFIEPYKNASGIQEPSQQRQLDQVISTRRKISAGLWAAEASCTNIRLDKVFWMPRQVRVQNGRSVAHVYGGGWV